MCIYVCIIYVYLYTPLQLRPKSRSMKLPYKDIDFAFNKRIYIFSIYVIFSKD